MENIRTTIRNAILGAGILLVGTSCVSYESQKVGFKPPRAHDNVQQIAGAQIAATEYADRNAAKQAFGFDVRKAGLLPVQVIFNNKGKTAFKIVPGQTFLIDEESNYWNLLKAETAYKRVEEGSEYSRIAKSAGKRSVLGAAGGAIVGGAIGILTGENVAASAGKGAAVGGAGGAVIGGAEEMSDDSAEKSIKDNLEEKDLQNQKIEPTSLARGFLFFPGEAPSAQALQLQVRETDSGEVHNVTFDF